MSDWEIVSDVGEWEPIQEMDNPELLKENLSGIEKFYRGSGIHGANRGFSKIFGFGKHVEDMRNKYEEAYKTHPIATQFGNIVAQVYSAIPFMMAGARAASKLSGASKSAQYYKNIAGAFGGGVTMGAFEHPEDGETRAGNALTAGAETAAFEVVAPLIKYGVKELKKLPKNLFNTPERLAQAVPANTVKAISEGFEAAKDLNRANYSSVFNSPNAPKISTYMPSQKHIVELQDLGGSGVDMMLTNYMADATPQNLKFLESEILAARRAVSGKKSIGEVAKNKTRKVFDDILYDINHEFEKILPNELHPRLRSADKFYKKEVLPYKAFEEALAKYSEGAYPATEITKKAGRSPDFRGQFGEKYPGINYAYSENPLVNAPGALPLGAGSAYQYLIKKLTGGF